MRKLIMWNVVTLDGCFEGEKPWDLSFHNLVWGAELEALGMTQLQEADMLVFGKNTYTGMAEYWTNAKNDDPHVAKYMNTLPKIVCSRTLKQAEWNNTKIINDAVPDLTKIKSEGNGPMYIFGSANLSESLLNAGILDEIRLCVAPVILGAGRRLFTDRNMKRSLKLRDAKTLSNGGIVLTYECLTDNK